MNKIQKQYKIIENLTKLSAKEMFEELGFKQVLCINQNNSEHAQIKYEAVFANCIKREVYFIPKGFYAQLYHYDYEEQDEFKKIPFNELFKDQIKIIDNHIDLTNEIINKASDDIQTIIDLLNSKIVTMGHIDVAIKKLEIIQDKLMGMKEDVE